MICFLHNIPGVPKRVKHLIDHRTKGFCFQNKKDVKHKILDEPSLAASECPITFGSNYGRMPQRHLGANSEFFQWSGRPLSPISKYRWTFVP